MDLKQIIDEYVPTNETAELVRESQITLLVGISGAGKDTIKQRLLDNADYHNIISHTTRPPRVNNGVSEVDGDDYHFIDDEQAHEMLTEHAFIEAKYVHGIVYGTSVKEVACVHDEHKIALTDIDVQGVDEYKQISQDVVAIFILPPSYDVWRERLMKRYVSTEAFDAEWPKRRASAIDELKQALLVPYYHFIINDDLGRSVRIADEIAHQGDLFFQKDDEARLAARELLSAIEAQN